MDHRAEVYGGCDAENRGDRKTRRCAALFLILAALLPIGLLTFVVFRGYRTSERSPCGFWIRQRSWRTNNFTELAPPNTGLSLHVGRTSISDLEKQLGFCPSNFVDGRVAILTWTFRFSHETTYSLFGVVPLRWRTVRSHSERLHQSRMMDGILIWIGDDCPPRNRILRAIEQTRLRRDAWSIQFREGPSQGKCLFSALSPLKKGDPWFVVERALGIPSSLSRRDGREVWIYGPEQLEWTSESLSTHLPASAGTGSLHMFMRGGILELNPLAPPNPESVDLDDFDSWEFRPWEFRASPPSASCNRTLR